MPTAKQENFATQPQISRQKPSASLTGFSLKDIINGRSASESGDEKPMPPPQEAYAEPEGSDQEKIAAAIKTLSTELTDERPRLATALSSVKVAGNMVRFGVSNDTLREEIERNMIEMKKRIAEIGDIKCRIEFEIVVEEDTSFIKPVQPEEKYKFLLEQNPELATFRKILDMNDLE